MASGKSTRPVVQKNRLQPRFNSWDTVVVGLECDPNRGAFLARIFNPDNNINNYVLAPDKIKVGNVIMIDQFLNIL